MTILAALGPKARALVEAGRGAHRPVEGDLQRIETALRARLGPAALPPEGSVAPPPAVAAAAGWKAVAGAVVGAGLLGGALYLALGPARGPESEAPPPPPVLSAAITPAPVPEAPTEEAPAVATSLKGVPAASVAAPPAASPVASAPRTRDRLAEEVALLSRAMTALRTGHAGEALKALEEHQSKFPRGALGEERRAAKAQALCSLGRTSEGRAELARLAPQSPAAARAKEVCEPGSRSGPR